MIKISEEVLFELSLIHVDGEFEGRREEMFAKADLLRDELRQKMKTCRQPQDWINLKKKLCFINKFFNNPHHFKNPPTQPQVTVDLKSKNNLFI